MSAPDDVTDGELAAFRAVWREVGDLPYGPARSAEHVRDDGTLDVPALRAADAEADRLNDDVIRRAIAAARAHRLELHPGPAARQPATVDVDAPPAEQVELYPTGTHVRVDADGELDERAPHRCPRCLVRYPLEGYLCRGGWQTSPDPDGPTSRPHPPTLVERITP